MIAHLVPCSGGQPIALKKPNLYLGRREGTGAKPLSSETARCRMRLVNGWWEIVRIDPGLDLRINSRACESARIRPGDELAIGRARFRLEYKPPETESEYAISCLMAPTEEEAEAALNGSAKASPAPPTPAPPPAPPVRAPLLTRKVEHQPPASQPQSPRLPGGLLAHLVPVGGGQDFPIRKPLVTVGRDSTCDIPLRVKTVSGTHCKLELIDGYWRVFDLGSRNGIRVDGVKCLEAWVFPESRLSISDQRFQLDYVPVGARPMADAADPRPSKSLMDKIGLKEKELDSILKKIKDEEGNEPASKRRDLTIDM